MITHSYPSAEFPERLGYFFLAPNSWEVADVPGALHTAVAPGEFLGVRPNITISWRRSASAVEVEDCARDLLESIRVTRKSPRVITNELVEIGDVPGALLVVSSDIDGISVEQAIVLLVCPSAFPEGTQGIYQVTGTYPQDSDEARGLVRASIESFTLIDETSSSPTNRDAQNQAASAESCEEWIKP